MILRRVNSNKSLDRACGAMHLAAIEEKVAFYLLTHGFNTKRKNTKEKKSTRSINPFNLIKRVKVVRRAKCENKLPHLRFRQDIFVCCLYPCTKQNKILVQTFRCAVALYKS